MLKKNYYKYVPIVVLIVCGLLRVSAESKNLQIIITTPSVPNYIQPVIEQETKNVTNPLIQSSVYESENEIYIINHSIGLDCVDTITNKVPDFGEDITFTSELFIREGFPHYVLYTPSSSVPHQDIPLIFWMHGGGEFGGSDEYFMGTGLLKVLNEWDMEGFNAYVVCPQMKDEYCYNWCTDFALDVVEKLINELIATYNIDPNRVYLLGHSQGARGVLHHSYYNSDYFAASVAFSPFNPSVKADLITIPIKAYTEYRIDFTSYLEQKWGYENVIRVSTSHGRVPHISLHIDENKNNRSDIIEWLFTHTKTTPELN